MTEYQLETAGRTDVGNGYTLETTNLEGVVTAPEAPGTRAFTTDIDGALEQAGLRLDKVLILPAAAATSARGFGDEADEDAAPTATLNVPVREDETCVLLVEDTATAALSWVLPDNTRDFGKAARARRSGTLRFSIPLESVAPTAGSRGLISDAAAVGKKVKAFFFKISDKLVGPIIHGFARKWEAKHRPAFSRLYGPDDYQIDDPKFRRLDADDWQRLARGPALLFVHGTFSTCGAFSALAPSVVNELAGRYEGRVLAFNHPTLTADPRQNAISFLRDIPDGVRLQLDIVCHSRGGLVARQIAALGETEGSVDVRRIVFVGAVNAGTALADDDHMIEMVDRFTTIANFIPQGAARKVVDALVLVVKVLGHGLLSELEGLSAMSPGGAFLKALNVPASRAPDYFAIASNFEPKAGTPFLSVRRIEDLAADRVFEGAGNDLVVPHDGVFAKNGALGFPIAEARCLRFAPVDAVVHTEFFAEPRTGTALLGWLAGEAAPTRALAERSRDEISRVLDAFRDQALAALTSRDNARALRDAQPTPTPADLEALRPHVVNLSGGTFKESGNYSTSSADVDAIAREHIPAWTASLPDGEPLRIVVWAHGGLVGERLGLQIAQKHVDWWKRNRVYPIYFVWETGLFDALRSILEAVARRIPGLGTRDLFDFTTDPLIQEGVRALGGVHVWGAMKDNAKLCSAADGGARYVAQRLREAVDNARDRNRDPQLHAVGHSAGSIFHSWFLPMATREIGLPAFSTLQLLAPAITIPDFSSRLAEHVGPEKAAKKAIMYTMKKSFEEDDSCIGIYRKSLLYLIHHALEPQRRTPVLGLDLSLRADAATSKLFGLQGSSEAAGRVVWSVTDAGDGRSSSRSRSHGGFDDDAPTMNSVAANVLNQAQASVPYPSTTTASRAVDSWPIADEWLEGVDLSAMGSGLALTTSSGMAASPRVQTAVASTPAQTRPAPKPPRPATGGGSRRALCVGIDAYPGSNALRGCVRDTESWGKALAALGFEVLDPLLNEQATYQGILSGLEELVRTAKRGDVLVFHYSGHGYQLPDTDDDEGDGVEEVFVPIDFEAGGFLLDDDVRAVLEQLPQGVNLTAFTDCCHSGTITRVFGRSSDEEEDGTRVRYLKPEEHANEWERAYVRFRGRVRTTRGMQRSRALVGADAMRWVNFAACSPLEKAHESDGNGHFTRIATRLIERSIDGFTNRSFQDALLKEFGEQRRQSPQLDCADSWRDLALLQSLR